MKWQDQGFILSARRHGESSFVVSVLTRDHGRHLGIVRCSKRDQTILQPGNYVQVQWSARLPEHLGSWQFELLSSPCARIFTDSLKLMGLTALVGVLDRVLAERHTYPFIFEAFMTFLETLLNEEENEKEKTEWLRAYVKFELFLLEQLGYGLDLGTCAATGIRENLVYISPKTGRAVCEEAGEPYKNRLFSLPQFFLKEKGSTLEDLQNGIKITSHFLTQSLFLEGSYHSFPDSRNRFQERLLSLSSYHSCS